MHIHDSSTTSYNPQANVICERMHQTIGNILRTLLHAHRLTDVATAEDLMDSALATATHSFRSTVSKAIQMTPGAMTFQRDMLLNIPLIADLQAIRDNRQIIINNNLIRANNKRRSHDYEQNELVLLIDRRMNQRKLSEKVTGPFQIR